MKRPLQRPSRVPGQITRQRPAPGARTGRTRRVIGSAVTLCVFAAVAMLWPQAAAAQQNPAPFGIVQLRVTTQGFDAILPWNKASEQSIQGNAIVVAGQRLIVAADLVKNANLIEVRKFGRYPDYPARPVLVDYDLNLALLAVDDPAFWEHLTPLPLSTRPLPRGPFSINRWRANGPFEAGTGEVVDHRVSSSPFGLMEFPVMRANTTMTGLGWSEVLIAEGQIIGLITSQDEQQIQATNGDLIALFNQAARQEPYEGFAHRGFAWQQVAQPDLRRYFGLEGSHTGVLIRKLLPGGTGSALLQRHDILHRINGYDVDPEGQIDHPYYGLIRFTAAINESLAPTVSAEIERGGRRMTLQLARRRLSHANYRVPPPGFDRQQDHEVLGGLVLQQLSLGYLRAWGREWRTKAPARLVIEYSLNSLHQQAQDTEQVVVVSRVLADPANLGYEEVSQAIVTALNGQPVTSLQALREALQKPRGGYHILELLPGQGRVKLVFDAQQLPEVNRRIAERYGIPPRS